MIFHMRYDDDIKQEMGQNPVLMASEIYMITKWEREEPLHVKYYVPRSEKLLAMLLRLCTSLETDLVTFADSFRNHKARHGKQ